jgi:hypothetical protein
MRIIPSEANMENITKWIPIAGNWTFGTNNAMYEGPGDRGGTVPFGMTLCPPPFRSGCISTTVLFDDPSPDTAGRILLGYNHTTGANYTIGIGGHGYAFVVVELIPGLGWVPLQTSGPSSNIKKAVPYEITVNVRGTRIQLLIDGIKVMDFNLPHPLLGDGVGLFAWSKRVVNFQNTAIKITKPKAFVVMQFGTIYDSIYEEVIKPVCESKGFEAFRADEVYQPGIILNDIVGAIIESEIVIAEVTSGNPNVYYEIGYAHAVGKSTILLVERGAKLPFDISSYRCIFYDNTIKGKNEVETSLGKHLDSINGKI